jgi:Lrp/AsnC family transcriptional regulator, leucine-responsive regulatory protein
MENLDETDRKILALLQQNAHLTFKQIAEQINLSLTPVHDRIKKLERDGIIENYVAILNKKKLGHSLLVYCNVTLSKQTQENFEAFNAAIKAMPEVLECSVVSGTFDYLLKVVVRDMEHYHTLHQQKLSILPMVSLIHSYFVMAEVKNSTAIPLK